MSKSIVIGVDVGGTFTDTLALDEATGAVRVEKVPSTKGCLLYTSPSPRDVEESRMPSSA